MEFADPVIDIAVEPKTKAEQDKMSLALQKLAEEDPTFRVSTNHETGQTIIAGMGELHLEIIVDRLLREFKVEANVGKPRLLTASVRATKYSAPKASSCVSPVVAASMVMRSSTCTRRKLALAICSENKIVGGVVPKEYIPAIDKGIQEALHAGVLAGYPCRGRSG